MIVRRCLLALTVAAAVLPAATRADTQLAANGDCVSAHAGAVSWVASPEDSATLTVLQGGATSMPPVTGTNPCAQLGPRGGAIVAYTQRCNRRAGADASPVACTPLAVPLGGGATQTLHLHNLHAGSGTRIFGWNGLLAYVGNTRWWLRPAHGAEVGMPGGLNTVVGDLRGTTVAYLGQTQGPADGNPYGPPETSTVTLRFGMHHPHTCTVASATWVRGAQPSGSILLAPRLDGAYVYWVDSDQAARTDVLRRAHAACGGPPVQTASASLPFGTNSFDVAGGTLFYSSSSLGVAPATDGVWRADPLTFA
ncbi:MAG TPA: hypothetical protein VIL64_02380 [Solirubrobacteraceae bacterium]